MQTMTEDLNVLDRLNLALEAEALPKGARDHAAHLIRRLSSPVRVACIGPAASGKSQLINMFIGQRVLPSGRPLPALEVVWGDAPSLAITHADGRVETIGMDAFDTADLSRAAFLKFAIPADILKRISFLEVTPAGDPADQRAAVDWAIRRTDIALWCSQSFSATEHQLWSRVPDSLKDHAFLVLTKADRLGADGTLGQRIAELNAIVAEEFHSMFPVATLHALAAVAKDGSVDVARRRASGGGNLIDEVLRHAERGRRADMDSAYLFLSRYQVRSTPDDLVAARTPSRPSPQLPSSDAPLAAEVTEIAPATDEAPSDQFAAPDSPAVVPVAPEITRPANIAIFEDGVRFLRRRGGGLAETAANLGPGNAKSLIDQCVDTVEHLVDLFSQEETEDPVTDEFIDELAEAAELMVLMQVEDGDAPAADAVTLLLQLRRDMETKLVA